MHGFSYSHRPYLHTLRDQALDLLASLPDALAAFSIVGAILMVCLWMGAGQ